MSEKRNLLFSKRDKADKSTSMGEEPGLLGMPKNNQQLQNSENKDANKEEEIKNNENKQKNKGKKKKNENKIEKTGNELIKKTSSKRDLPEIINENDQLTQQIESLKKEIEKEREGFLEDIKANKKENNKKNNELRKLTNIYNKKIEILKNYEKNLEFKGKIRTRNKVKSEEEIKKELKLLEQQIKKYEDRGNLSEKNYQLSLKKAQKEENKENEYQEKLNDLKQQVSDLEDNNNNLRKILQIHENCKKENEKLIEKYNSVNNAYKCQIKIAKQLALAEIKDKLIDERDKNIIEKDKHKEVDDANQIKKDEMNILPKIKSLNFQNTPLAKLEAKILKKNKVGIKNNFSNLNALNLYNKLCMENSDNDRYIKEANKNIHINNIKTNITTEENYLFKDYENNILKKAIPVNLLNSYRGKFNKILKEKKELKKQFINRSSEIKSETLNINNQKDFNGLKLKQVIIENSVLDLKYKKNIRKIFDIKKKIKEIDNQIKKEEDKIKLREKEKKRLQFYFQQLVLMKKSNIDDEKEENNEKGENNENEEKDNNEEKDDNEENEENEENENNEENAT